MVEQPAGTDWLQSFVPVGVLTEESWNPAGAGFLFVDMPVVWLVTATAVVERVEQSGGRAGCWIRRSPEGVTMVDVSTAHQQSGTRWIHGERGISIGLFPTDPNFRIKAFAAQQCSRLAELKPLMPVVSLGGLFSRDSAHLVSPDPMALDGIVSRVDTERGLVFTTAPMLPRNQGAPLFLASPYSGSVTMAGILTDNVLESDVDPRIPPVRIGVATPVDAVLELVARPDAQQQRHAVTGGGAAPTSSGEGSRS